MNSETLTATRSLALVAMALGCATGLGAQAAVLEIAVLEAGAGRVQASIPSGPCASVCNVTMALGSTVNLRAAPAAGYQFESWAGDCLGSLPTCTLQMDGTKLAVASFKSVDDSVSVLHRFMPGGLDGRTPPFGDLLAVGGYLYGMTWEGGRADAGTVFRELPDGTGREILHEFLGGARDGGGPLGSLLELDGVLYGMTQSGSERGCTSLGADSQGCGTIFKIRPDGSGYALLHSFAGTRDDGMWPWGSLVGLDGALYGMTWYGGAHPLSGTVFRINTDGSGFVLLHSFGGEPDDGSTPHGSLVAYQGLLYGMTYTGGLGGHGTVFSIDPDGGELAVLHAFTGATDDGSLPYGSLIVCDGALYGMTYGGGLADRGTIFTLELDGSGFRVLHSFVGGASDGRAPYGSLLEVDDLLFGLTSRGGANDAGVLFGVSPGGEGFAVLHSFGGVPSDGSNPDGSLAFFAGGLYGMTREGGDHASGTLFRIATDGTGYTVLHSFDGAREDGFLPNGPLTPGGAVLYGSTRSGGPPNNGTVFQIGPEGSRYSLLHTFGSTPSDGQSPAGAVLVSGNFLFGSTTKGGAANLGTVFRLGKDGGNYSVLHEFGDATAEGAQPVGELVESDGALFGATAQGGGGGGTIFRLTPDGGSFMVLHSFPSGPGDGKQPVGSLLSMGGTLYGMTHSGGTDGTVFRLDPSGGDYAIVHSFGGGASDGLEPSGSLLALDGTLLGMTPRGGANDLGTVFRLSPDGSGFSLLHAFAGGANGVSRPDGSLIASGSWLYGQADIYGPNNNPGGIFRLSPDGSTFELLYSFPVPSEFQPTGDSLVELNGGLFGVGSGGLGYGGVVFRLAPIPGDVSGNGLVDVRDVFYLINYLFADGAPPVGVGDANADGRVDVQDVFRLIGFLFAGGPEPLKPAATIR